MPDIVVAERLVKRYGQRDAVRGVSFTIAAGEVVGLLGPNGSGKSTILRMLTGYLQPTSGSIRIGALDLTRDALAARGRIGYVPEDTPLYEGMRVREFLRFMAELRGVAPRATAAAVDGAIARLQLERVVAMPIGKLSRGYRQRVAIAQALLASPEILVLDEPTNGLDAYQVIGIRALLRDLAGQCTVILASHVLSEIEKIASRVMILANGRLLTADAGRAGGLAPRLRLRVAGPRAAVLAELTAVPGVVAATADPSVDPSGAVEDGYVVEPAPGAQPADGIARALIGRGFALLEMTPLRADLERAFLDLTRQAEAA